MYNYSFITGIFILKIIKRLNYTILNITFTSRDDGGLGLRAAVIIRWHIPCASLMTISGCKRTHPLCHTKAVVCDRPQGFSSLLRFELICIRPDC